jgi:ubiquinone/menaquinone biosynthesis C-methylase UbiE
VNLYERYILPRVIHLAMRNTVATAERARFVPLATGTILEIGAGSGLNLPFYGSKVVRLYALDPSRELWRMARRRVDAATFPVEYLAVSAEGIPLDDRAVDTVVTTRTLCSIPDPGKALAEIAARARARGPADLRRARAVARAAGACLAGPADAALTARRRGM